MFKSCSAKSVSAIRLGVYKRIMSVNIYWIQLNQWIKIYIINAKIKDNVDNEDDNMAGN